MRTGTRPSALSSPHGRAFSFLHAIVLVLSCLSNSIFCTCNYPLIPRKTQLLKVAQKLNLRTNPDGRGKQFDVLLSFNTNDGEAAGELANELKSRGLRLWILDEQLLPGRHAVEVLEGAIKNVATVAVLVGPKGIRPWQEMETHALLTHFVSRGEGTIIPVLLPGAPDDVALPAFLATRAWVDLRNGFDRSAIDGLEAGIRGKPKSSGICFVVMPFGGWFDGYYEHIYSPAIESVGLEPRRADDLYRPSNIVNDIWSLTKAARVVLADLSGKNANIFYKLGLAHALAKPAPMRGL